VGTALVHAVRSLGLVLGPLDVRVGRRVHEQTTRVLGREGANHARDHGRVGDVELGLGGCDERRPPLGQDALQGRAEGAG
jgi:hypothetical protein